MGMNEKDIPYGVGVLVAKDGKFLCGLRSDTGEICGPGGHLEKDESPEHAAVRETQEEFDITPKNLKMIGCLRGREGYYLPTMVFLCTDFDGEPKADGDELVDPYGNFEDIAELEEEGAEIYPAFYDSLSLLGDRIRQNGQNGGHKSRLVSGKQSAQEEKTSIPKFLSRVKKATDKKEFDGGAGSGNWGHSGRPGLRGGSGSGGSMKVTSLSQLKKGDKVTFHTKEDDPEAYEYTGRKNTTETAVNGKVTAVYSDHVIITGSDGTKYWADNDTVDFGSGEGSQYITKNKSLSNQEKVARMVKNMTPQEKELFDKAQKDSASAVDTLNNTFQKNMDTWNSASSAVKNGKDPVTATAAQKDHTIPGASKAAQKAYDDSRAKEKQISKDLIDGANKDGSALYGLDYSVKTGKSIANKIERKQSKDPKLTDEKIVSDMGDLVRYTKITDHDSIASTAKQTVKDLESKGYKVNEFDNKYQNAKSDYKGIHIGAVSPSGQQIELQIHSRESMKVKETIHPMYDIARDANTPQRVKKALGYEMNDISKSMRQPKGVMDSSMKSWKR